MPHTLIVDDEPAIRSLLLRSFTRAGYDVTVASDASGAMAYCRTHSFDVLLSDVDMPRINGHELVRWLAANHPRTRAVLMSALNTECEECPFAPQCRLLRKPFNPQEAVDLITAVLDHRFD
jgi:CheY-like chemotaxis protein